MKLFSLRSLRGLALVLASTFAAGVASAADGIESRPLNFARNASSATVRATIVGRHSVDYRLRARAGQRMSVTLRSPNQGLAFNVLPPGSRDVAIPGAIEQQSWEGVLPADGEYVVRVYLTRSSARRGERGSYTLTVAIAGASSNANATGSGGGAEDATRRASEGRFNATGKIPCAQSPGQPMGQCDFGVARAGGGTATVVVTLPDGRRRAIFFEKGRPVGADLSQADGDTTFRATRESDLNLIRAGRERYEIVDAVPSGG